MSGFLDMGAYAAYVWAGYGITAVLLTGLAWASWRRARLTAERLRGLEAEAPHRRRNREGRDGG